jgi:hypothetical protein
VTIKRGRPTIGFAVSAASAKEDEAFDQVSPMSCWPRFLTVAFALSGTLLVAACGAEAPYVFTDYRFHQRGLVIVCFNDATATTADAKKLADETCRQYDRTSRLAFEQAYQCSWTAPTQAIFNCVPRPGENPPPITEHLSPLRHDTPLPAQ